MRFAETYMSSRSMRPGIVKFRYVCKAMHNRYVIGQSEGSPKRADGAMVGLLNHSAAHSQPAHLNRQPDIETAQMLDNPISLSPNVILGRKLQNAFNSLIRFLSSHHAFPLIVLPTR